MFKVTNNTNEILQKGGRKDQYAKAKTKRQKVYKFLHDHPESQRREIAMAVGYDMNLAGSKEYTQGMNYIHYLITHGYLDETIGKDGQRYLYIGTKESLEDDIDVEGIKKEAEQIRQDFEELKQAVAEEEAEQKEPTEDEEFPELDEFLEELQKEKESNTPDLDEIIEGLRKAGYGVESKVRRYNATFEVYEEAHGGNAVEIWFKDRTKEEMAHAIKNLNLEDIIPEEMVTKEER